MRSSPLSLCVLGYAASVVANPVELGSVFSIPLMRKRGAMSMDGMANINALTEGVRKTHYKFGLTPPDYDLATLKKRQAGFVQMADVTGDIVSNRLAKE